RAGGDVLAAGLQRGLGGGLGTDLPGTRLRRVRGRLPLVVAFTHASSPFIWCVGVACRAASSAARAAASRFTPSGSFFTCSCSAMIELTSISGRGGQPGR